jgi:hypothetical protein
MSPLLGNTDNLAGVPTWLKNKAGTALAIARQSLPANTRIIFVSTEEAMTAEAKANGMGIPGWYSYLEYTAGTETRRRVELLVEASVASAVAGDTGVDAGSGAVSDDDILTTPVISITTQPADVELTDPDGSLDTATFTVVAAVDPTATLGYQWGVSEDGGVVWSVLVGETTDTLVITPDALGTEDGFQYRCVVSAAGAESVVTEPATLTVIIS